MKRIVYLLLAVCCLCSVTSCRNDETYAEQKERERNAITAFVERNEILMRNHDGDTLLYMPKIKVISEAEFEDHDTVTNVDENEFVLFASTGVYMQIVRPGAGERIKSGESKTIVSRYFEYNIIGDSLQSTDNVPYWEPAPGIIEATNTDGTISAIFNTSLYGGGAMYSYYRSTAVPSAWLLPLRYIKLGRQVAANQGAAKVRLIVPHTEGHSDAMTNVYPCFYEISFVEMRH